MTMLLVVIRDSAVGLNRCKQASEFGCRQNLLIAQGRSNES